jgi:NADPH-dependent glutamate synthase beta subunit-like oxidoreductase
VPRSTRSVNRWRVGEHDRSAERRRAFARPTPRPSERRPCPGTPACLRRLAPPCNSGCPAGENIEAWLARITAGRPEAAWRELVKDNPLPAIHGRVCYHPCESVCNRVNLDSAVSIHSVERFLGDLALEQGWRFDAPPAPSGKRVLVVGAGPSGLSAAYHLARRGHDVEIRDSGAEPGGMMRSVPRWNESPRWA